VDDPADYTVKHSQYGAYVMGYGAPTDEMDGLLRAWHYRKLSYVSHALAKRLGALVVVTAGTGDEQLWLRELGEET